MNIKQSIGLSSLLLTSVIANAGVGGTVFQDLPLNGNTTNTYGTKDNNEKGLSGIIVTAYSPLGDTPATTTTDANGSWSLQSSGKVRIEFTNLPTYLNESAGESSVQFIDGDASNVNLALYNPADYTTGKSDIAMTFQPNAALNTNDTPIALKILRHSDIPVEAENAISLTVGDIPFNQMGTVWGLAYDNSKNVLYTSAAVRRHSAVGPMGTGGIYKINLSDSSIEQFIRVEDTGTIPNDRNLSADSTQPSRDPVFDEVGRVGLGDLDISTDGKKLYTININNNDFIEIDISTKTQTAHNIGNPFGGDCPSADVTSWGIGQNSGKVYVGSICTTNTTQGAYISEFDGTTFTPFHSIPLDMEGEHSLDTIFASTSQTLANNKRWGKWITESSALFDGAGTRSSLAAPILSDIIFDEDKGMILGFIDRTALQSGVSNFSPTASDNNPYKYDAAGNIYRVCNTSSGYQNEGSELCPQNDTETTATSYPEFFIDEEWIVGSVPRHKETALGGLAYEQGSNSIISSAFDPINVADQYNTSGLIWMNTNNGEKTAGKIMVGGRNDISYNGKAGGIGDIELLTPPAPTEIGNRVWFDDNDNCVQDANESGVAGVEVNLYEASDCTGTAEGTVTTDENGNYLFPVNAGTTYSVCINNISGQSVLEDKKLTTCKSDESTIHNSDATLDGTSAKIAISPLSTGANNHSFDFGFTSVKSVVPTPIIPVVPVLPPENNRTVEDTNESCECNSFNESSTPSLNNVSILILIFLTSFTAFLFRKELNQPIK